MIGIPKKEIEWNEEGEMIGYKGELSSIVIFVFIGLIIGVIIGLTFKFAYVSWIADPFQKECNNLSLSGEEKERIMNYAQGELSSELWDMNFGEFRKYGVEINSTSGRYRIWRDGKILEKGELCAIPGIDAS